MRPRRPDSDLQRTMLSLVRAPLTRPCAHEQDAPDVPDEPRGVYIARHRNAAGGAMLYPVDRRGHRVAWFELPPTEEWEQRGLDYKGAAAGLKLILEALDPETGRHLKVLS